MPHYIHTQTHPFGANAKNTPPRRRPPRGMPHAACRTHLVGSERRNRGRFERPVPFQPPTVRRDEELFLIFLRLRLPMLMLMMVGGLLLLRLGGGLLVTVPLLSHKLLLSLTRKPDLYGGIYHDGWGQGRGQSRCE